MLFFFIFIQFCFLIVQIIHLLTHFFVRNSQKSLLFLAFEAFAEGVGVDIPAEEECQLLAEVVEGMRIIVVKEHFVVAAAVMNIVAHLRVFVRLRAGERRIGEEHLLHPRLALLLRERILCGGC